MLWAIFAYCVSEVGDFIERDEELATIETDKVGRRCPSLLCLLLCLVTHKLQIDVSVNATDSGTVKELLVNEEDTVTVGQDLAKLELGGAPEGKKEEAAEKPKEPATPEKSQPSEPEPPKSQEAPKTPPQQPPAPKPESPKPQPESPKPQPSSDAKPASGSRDERRVRIHSRFVANIRSLC